ncbi:MAG TPA: hypothetical protein VI455_07005 [Terriglobia bacterium]
MAVPILKARTIQSSLRLRGRTNLFLVLIVFPAFFLAFEALRITTASSLGESTDVMALKKALSIDSSNPALHHRLGVVRFNSSAGADLEDAIVHLRRATELNPGEALYWSDLASACESAGDTACSDHSVERALALSPRTPRLFWSAANHYLRTNRRERALPLFRRLLELDSGYAPATFQVCLPMLGSAEFVEEGVLGANQDPQLELAFVSFLSDRGQDDSAYAGWRRVELKSRTEAHPENPPFAFPAVAPYLNHLIDLGRENEALAVWHDLERLGVVADADPDSPGYANHDERVFNGGFEQPVLNSGFDWRYRRQPFVSIGFSGAAHWGSHCLRIEFSAEQDDEYEPIYQLVPVQPGQRYVLSAFVRSDAITSDSGPRLRVLDPFCLNCLTTATEPTVATTPWHPIRLAFETGPKTHLVKISIWRPRSRAFPAEVRGTFWLDDVSLTATNPPGNLTPGPPLGARVTNPPCGTSLICPAI